MNYELMKKICDLLPEESIEDMKPVEVDGVKYDSYQEEELTTEDEGKYQYGGFIYGIGIHDSEKGYGITGEPLFYVEQDFTQCGNYFEYQERIFEKPFIVEQKEIVTTVWKAVKAKKEGEK